MTHQSVSLEIERHIATIRLDRADNRNSMTPDLLEGVSNAVAQVRGEADVRCVVITGSGDTFCGGKDFKSAAAVDESIPAHERTYAIYSHFLSVLELEVPTIAAMNGDAVGGGLGLSLVCDIRVANADAHYGAPFVRVGMHPGMASTLLLPRFMGVPNATELLLTGRVVNGAEAQRLGLVNHAVSPDDVLPKAMTIAEEIASAAPLAVRWTKRSINDALSADIKASAYREAMQQSRSTETDDFNEGVRAHLKGERPDFKGR